MLSGPDADLIRRDHAIRGLALAIDREAFAATLRSVVADHKIGQVRCSYVRYKPGTSCLVGYRAEVEDHGALDIYAKAYSDQVAHKLRKASTHSNDEDLLSTGCAVLPDTNMSFHLFPHDAEMKTLARLVDPRSRPEILRRVSSRHPGLYEGRLEPLSYKPERRFVGKLLGSGASAVVIRCYTSADYARAESSSKGVKSRGVLKAAKRLGRSNRHFVLAFPWLHGESLDRLLRDPNTACKSTRLAGAALADLHAQRIKHVPALTSEYFADRLRELAGTISMLCPWAAAQIQAVTSRLAKYVADDTSDRQLIHGDFYSHQVLIQESTAAILDLDELVYAPAVADLGNFIAHLHWDVLTGQLPYSAVHELSDALLEGYEQPGRRVATKELDVYTAISLISLAPHAFRSRHPDWSRQIECLVSTADKLFGGSAPRSNPSGRQPVSSGAVSTKKKDLSGAARDPKLPFLAAALDAREAQRQLERNLVGFVDRHGPFVLRNVRVVRHKPGKRCLIEYKLALKRPTSQPETISLLGKVRARGLDRKTFRLGRYLWNHGFDENSDDGVSVPEPIGCIPEFQMWLQRKVAGRGATELVGTTEGVTLARKIACAIFKLHQSGVETKRHHTIDTELKILAERLGAVADSHPQWRRRSQEVFRACSDLRRELRQVIPTGIHRDFYPDQVLVNGSRIYLLDLDLFSRGHPGLDIGNFQAHLVEQALRQQRSSDALADVEESFRDHYLDLAGEELREPVQLFVTLTLARHIYISTKIPGREYLTGSLFDLCEERLSAMA